METCRVPSVFLDLLPSGVLAPSRRLFAEDFAPQIGRQHSSQEGRRQQKPSPGRTQGGGAPCGPLATATPSIATTPTRSGSSARSGLGLGALLPAQSHLATVRRSAGAEARTPDSGKPGTAEAMAMQAWPSGKRRPLLSPGSMRRVRPPLCSP
jgi:hypothetical protein